MTSKHFHKNRINIVLSVICFIVVSVVIGKILHFALIDDTNSYTRLTMHEFYNDKENIDVIFLGTSHAFRAYHPDVFDEVALVHSFNLGSALQGLDASYALLVEACKYNDLKEVYLDIFPESLVENYKERRDMTSTYIVSDYMRPSINKAMLLLNASSKDYYVNGFVLPRRNWKMTGSAEYIDNLVRSKLTSKYLGYQYVSTEYDSYCGRGFVGSPWLKDIGYCYLTTDELVLNEPVLSNDSEKYLRKILDYCKKKNIKLTLLSAPSNDLYYSICTNYNLAAEEIHNIVDEYGVPYYDFNLIKKEELNITYDKYIDATHLNNYGADELSYWIAKNIYGNHDVEEIKKLRDCFYNSLEEKYATEKFEFLGLIFNIEDDVLSWDVVGFADTKFEYAFSIEKDNEIIGGDVINDIAQISIDTEVESIFNVEVFKVLDGERISLGTIRYKYVPT